LARERHDSATPETGERPGIADVVAALEPDCDTSLECRTKGSFVIIHSKRGVIVAAMPPHGLHELTVAIGPTLVGGKLSFSPRRRPGPA
jgi:hypothetical protein